MGRGGGRGVKKAYSWFKNKLAEKIQFLSALVIRIVSANFWKENMNEPNYLIILFGLVSFISTT